MTVPGHNRALKVAVMSKLAFDAKPAPSVLPVGNAHLFATYLGGSRLHGEGDVLLQSTERLVSLRFERVGEHAAVG